MINTAKLKREMLEFRYEGHTEGKWNVLVSSEEDIAQAHLHDETAGYYFFSQGANSEQEENYNHNESRANARLMSDAPLLLAEVKKLRDGINYIAYLPSLKPSIAKMMKELIE
tara:strand:- start:8865 stop:9203 length:339 start_codon:yes stop_codon:yes gene_type:complete